MSGIPDQELSDDSSESMLVVTKSLGGLEPRDVIKCVLCCDNLNHFVSTHNVTPVECKS
jgi:hypothetical protein